MLKITSAFTRNVNVFSVQVNICFFRNKEYRNMIIRDETSTFKIAVRMSRSKELYIWR